MLRLKHVDFPLAHVHHEYTKEVFHDVQTLSRIQISNMGNNPESGPSIMMSASIEMGHTHIQAFFTDHHAELIKPASTSCSKH